MKRKEEEKFVFLVVFVMVVCVGANFIVVFFLFVFVMDVFAFVIFVVVVFVVVGFVVVVFVVAHIPTFSNTGKHTHTDTQTLQLTDSTGPEAS